MAAEQGVKASEAGEAITAEAGEAIRLLGERLAHSADAAQQILASAQQQLTGIDQVALAMQNIRQASAQNMASTRQVEQAARELDGLSQRLTELVAPNGRRAAHDRRGRMPRRDAELKARLLATFQVEADEHLVALRRHLLALSDAGRAEARDAGRGDVPRDAHAQGRRALGRAARRRARLRGLRGAPEHAVARRRDARPGGASRCSKRRSRRSARSWATTPRRSRATSSTASRPRPRRRAVDGPRRG